MANTITKQDIDFLRKNSRNPQAIKQYLQQRGLSDASFSSSYIEQSKVVAPQVISDYAVAYESARKLYFSTVNSIKSANDGKIPLSYKPLVKKYLNYWKTAGEHVWILFFIDSVSSVKIFNNDGSVNLSVFRETVSDNNLSGISVILGALAIVGGLVAFTIIAVNAINKIKEQASGNRPYKTLMQLTTMLAKGQITQEQYNQSVAQIQSYIKTDQQKTLFYNILLYSGGIFLTFASGYVIYEVMVKKKSVKQIGSDIVTKIFKKTRESDVVSNLVSNSATSLTNSVIKNIVTTGSKL